MSNQARYDRWEHEQALAHPMSNGVPTVMDRVKQRFERFGIDVVEATANGVWIEDKFTKAGKHKGRGVRLAFLTRTDLAGLLLMVDTLAEEKKSREVE